MQLVEVCKKSGAAAPLRWQRLVAPGSPIRRVDMRTIVPVALVALFLFAMASTAMAEERTSWVGRDVDNNRVIWSCTRSGGDNWRVSRNGNSDTYETVADDGETLDLQLKGDKG